MGITDSNDATGKRNIVFFKTSRTTSLCRNSVDGDRALKWDEIAQEKGPGELARPQSTSTQCPSMRERISHTQSTEFERISRRPSRWLSKFKSTFVFTAHDRT